MKRFGSGRERRTYQSWCDMRSRCNHSGHRVYARYGGRGIRCCERWGSFELFVADMGFKPDGYTLERTDNDGDYCPENCVWADYRAQNKNKRTTTRYEYDGRSQTIEEWAAEFGMGRTTLSNRIHRGGMSIEESLTLPVRK